MKQLFAPLLVLSMFSTVTVGCTEKSTTTNETAVTTPGGTTTVINQPKDESRDPLQNRPKDEKQIGSNVQRQGAPSNGPQQRELKDQQQSESKDLQQSESKDQQEAGPKGQKQGTPQNQTPDDLTKKEKK